MSDTIESILHGIETAAASREPRTLTHGVVRQGDIYIHCVAREHAHGGARGKVLTNSAAGTSAHTVEGDAEIYEGTNLPPGLKATGPAYQGPCIVVRTEAVVTHPEHAHVRLSAGVYQVTHQVDARTLERVSD